MKQLRLGLIGAGRWARAYVKTIDTLPGVHIARVARRSPGTPDFLSPGMELTTDWKTVACASDLDGVIIATPPSLHAAMAEAAINAGRPVLIEKPLTLSLAEATRLRDAAVRNNRLVMVEHTHLFNPAYRELKRRAADLGPVRGIATEAGNRGPFRKDVPILWDWGAHDVALCLDLMKQAPVRVSGKKIESRETPEGNGEAVALNLEFAGGVEARIRLSNLLEDKKRTMTVYFDSCCLVFDDVRDKKLARYASRALFEKTDDTSGTAIAAPGPLPLAVAVGEFCDAIRSGSTDRASLDLGVDVVAVLEKCSR